MSTGIEWCDEVWNPVTGCTPVSEGCKNCYAKRMATRLAGRYGYPKDDPFAVTFHPDRLWWPEDKWKKARHIFPVSMGDLFHKDVTDAWLCEVFQAMRFPHTYLLLTKRAQRMADWMKRWGELHCTDHLWLGVSVESWDHYDRICDLLEIKAAVHFISFEPLLSPVDIVEAATCWAAMPDHVSDIEWVICGCESGPGRRETRIEWIRGLRDQCVAAGVPFFLKQMSVNGKSKSRRGGVVKMPPLDGKVWDQVPDLTTQQLNNLTTGRGGPA